METQHNKIYALTAYNKINVHFITTYYPFYDRILFAAFYNINFSSVIHVLVNYWN